MPRRSALILPSSESRINVRRRDLLINAGLLVSALSLSPSRAQALGGVVLKNGEPVPDFDLPGSSRSEPNRERWNSKDLRGRWLAVYFYPRDFTGGCTIEARGFEALHKEFSAVNTEVIGISADSVDDHEEFCDSEGLSFPLLSDPDGVVSKAYGSWMAPYSLRHSFLIDPEGILRERWVAVRPSGHAKEVLEAIQALQSTVI